MSPESLNTSEELPISPFASSAKTTLGPAEDRTPPTVSLDTRHPAISILLRQFSLHVDALRDMLNEIIPRLHEMDTRSLHPDVLFAVAELPAERQEEFWQYVREQFNTAVQDHPTLVPADEIVFTEGPLPVDAPPGTTVEIALELNRLVEILGNSDRHYVGRFRKLIVTATAGPRRVTIVHNSLLTMGIGAFEVLVAGLLTRHFVLHRGALNDEEKVFSLQDLRQFEDIDDAADYLISKRVSVLMHGNVDDWGSWFQKNFGTNFTKLSTDFEAVVEAFQRRHIVVHNGGLVSRQYLAALPARFEKPALGSRLEIDREYLHQVFDHLDALGTALAVTAWGNWVPSERESSAGTLLDRTYELMIRERWSPALHLATLGRGFNADQATIAAITCNQWHCRTELEGRDCIRGEVLAWDTSAMKPLYAMIRLVLLGDVEEAVAAIPEMLRQGEVTRGELKGWPIFRPLRECETFEAALIDAEIGILSDEDV